MKGIGIGMKTTMQHFLRPGICEQYPVKTKELPPRSRMSFALTLDENGVPTCSSCMLCVRNCPDDAIVLESEKVEGRPGKVLTKFTMDLGRCMYCGLCVENCTTQGLRHTGDFETCSHKRSGTMLVLYEADPATRPLAPELADLSPGVETERPARPAVAPPAQAEPAQPPASPAEEGAE